MTLPANNSQITVHNTSPDVSLDQTIVRVNVVNSDIAVKVQDTGIQGPRGTQLITGVVVPDASIGLEGDQYINKLTSMLYGPKIGSSWGTGYLLGGAGTAVKFAMSLGNGVTKTWTIAHGLDTSDLIVIVKEVSTNDIVFPAVSVDASNVVVYFQDAPATNEYRIVVI